MNRQVPTLGKLLTMVIFALSCFGLTLFLWLQFGGAVPFKAQGYRITATFPEATSLAVEADVRIAGVAIGRVKKVVPGQDGRAIATLQIEKRFAPLPKNTKAILRQKTLLGETYVSLTPPGQKGGDVIPEGGRIPNSDIGTTTELDEVFATFNPETRKYFQQWMQEGGKGIDGKGPNIGQSLVQLQGFVSELAEVSNTLNEEQPYLKSGLRDARTVLEAATTQRGALQRAVTQSERVFRQTGDNDAALTALIERLPEFLTATKTGTKAIEDFAQETGPAVERLRPTAKALAPATKALSDVAPELRQLLEGIERVNENAKEGLPAAEKTLEVLPVLLDGLDPFLKELNPILEYAGFYSDELMGALGNLAASANTSTATANKYRDGGDARNVRGMAVLQASSLTASQNRFSTEQANAYRRAGWASKIGQGLADAYSAQSCGTVVPRLPDTTKADLNALESAKPTLSGNVSTPDVSLLDALRYSLFSPYGYFASTSDPADPAATTPSEVPAPTTPKTAPADCTVQGQFSLAAGRLSTYPQLPAAPSSTERSVTGN
ncbi:MAG: MCE family protein [Solirubrobacteraceae bacterium]|nr:MCE family protein [Solirubrobacteraceae bacterium]